MRSSLRLKLIFTFIIISLAGTFLTSWIVRFSNERAFDDLLGEKEQTEFVNNVLAYYESTGSWEGVNQRNNDQHGSRSGNGSSRKSLPFALVDVNGRILIQNRQHKLDGTVSAAMLDDGIPLEVDGTLIGIVLQDDQPQHRDPAEEAFIAETNRALWIGAGGATAVAVVLAIFMSRTLTRPLQELSHATRQMAQGNLQQTVPVRTQDELGELATTFNQMSAELDRANQIRRQMTADIAHDLRTPLTVLSGYLEVMEDGTLPPTPTRLALMQQEVKTLQRLVTDLRTLSLADTGELTLQKEPTAISNLLVQVHDAFAHQSAQQAISLVVNVDATLPTISVDPARIRQVLSNLVGNALRYTPANGEITLSSTPSASGGLQITVSDTGSGIPEADLPHVFNRFYRGDRSRQTEQGESGLGLAIAKSLVVAHDGTIEVTSRQGAGTTFTIFLGE
ncbi:MAG: HAMP domain-containing protein [Chloroflexi bacterium]|nr:MAG: HAMP domain-containing protein [Chloroflexota bacterium]